MSNAHGKYEITTAHNIIILDATGPFNLQHVNNLSIDMAKYIAAMNSYWGQITIFHNDSLFVQEALVKIKLSMQERAENGLKCIAIVLIDSQCSFLIKQQITEIYESANIPFDFFDTYHSAEKWLTRELKEYS